MKKTFFLAAIAIASSQAFAQSNLKYSDEGFITKKVEKSYDTETPGQLFLNRMNTLYAVANKNAEVRITQGAYNEFLQKFEKLFTAAPYDATIANNLNIMANILNMLNDAAYNNDEYRNVAYHIAMPVYTAVDEEWGSEIIGVALSNAYLDLREFTARKAIDDTKMAQVLQTIDGMRINARTTDMACDYSIRLDPSLTKDKIDVFIADPALYYKVSRKFPQSRLLAGPVMGWENYQQESASVINILNTYASAPEHKGYQIYTSSMTPGKGYSIAQKLNHNSKWFMMVFRNNMLYYSYMIEPCGMFARTDIH